MPNVPALAGLTQQGAEARLQSAGLTLGTVGHARSTEIAQGNVISSEPVADTLV